MSTIAPVDFGGLEELVVAEDAKPRMTPADERLESGDGAILEPHDGSVENRDLAALERTPHIVAQRLPVGAMEAHVGGENLHPIAASPFGVGERELSVGEKIAAFVVQLRIVMRRADRHRKRDFPFAKADRRGEHSAQGVDPGGRVHRARFGEHDCAEHVAAQASQRIAGAQIPSQAPGHRQKRRVADRQSIGNH